jgi:site-specific DNA recombinase
MKVVGYTRVSTQDQAIKGISLDAQEAALRAWAEREGHELVALRCDAGCSGGSMAGRPALALALGDLREGAADGLVVIRLDRLTRSISDLVSLVDEHFTAARGTVAARRRGRTAPAALFSLAEAIETASPAGRAMLMILGVMAQWERETITCRVNEALAELRAQGRRVGSIPRGHRLAADGLHLEPEPEEQEIIRLAREKRGQGMSLGGISNDLVSLGHLNRKGRPFAPTAVARMLGEAR